ncbi:MAG: PAS domain S-box protein [Burkholderiales bacterium]|nr:PAS domain S-box protein [Burkholderiales bacterium]MBH2017193.1 PAS domain S-box protein [Burkholderiales bacterium]
MASPVSVPPRPTLSVPPQPRLRLFGSPVRVPASLWAWPLILSLLVVGGVMFWLRSQEQASLTAQREEMISDALSLEAQMTGRLDGELAQLGILADLIDSRRLTPQAFDAHPVVLDGLRRFWVSVTWLSDAGRIQAHQPEEADPVGATRRQLSNDGGLTGHLSVSLAGRTDRPGGLLVARFSAAALLREKVPWWLASKYDIRMVDDGDDVIAATVEGPRDEGQAWYRVSLGPSLPSAWLELASRERIAPWWRTLPVALMLGFLGLIAGASVMLRKQMRSVSRAEEAWRTEAAWRTAMEDSLAVGIRARDLDGRLIYVNKTMADMVGRQPEELVGLLPPMPYWVPDELDQSMRRHLRNMAGQAPRGGYESRWQHRDGHIVEVMVYEAPLVDAQGVQIGWMASIVNITERKQLEERERRQMEAVAHQARLTMLGEVASTLAHELNQPLSAITSYNTGLLNALSGRSDVPEPVLKALQRQGEQAGQAARIVKRIREFLTRREPQREPCDLHEVIASGVGLLKRDIARHEVEVSLELADDLPRVIADPVLIEQVVVNLVRNACDAMAGQEGPRRIRIHAEASCAAPSVTPFVRVSVSDSGPGLHGQTVATLCAPFFTTKSDGMGMGLAICRSIIELHYGALDASESPSGGAMFAFSLPTTDADTDNDNDNDNDTENPA